MDRARAIGRLIVGVLAASGAASSKAQHAPFGVRDVMSAPFASELTAAPAGGRLAWILKQEGARDIWLAEPPEYKARRLTAYTADDGQEISALTWTPDGVQILYVRGGDPNRAGERPNPLSDPAGVSQAIHVVAVAGGESRKLAEGSAPAVSPKGERVAFLKAGDVWSVPLTGGAEPSLLVQARGGEHTLRWSPDGSRLAFVSDRGAHSFVGVYDADAKALCWLDPSVDQDISPVWSPDARSVAWLRLPASPKAIPFVPERAGTPWSIRVADATTGRGREVWRSKEGVGSAFRGVDSPSQLLWAADDRLVFPWEADGWTHLYSVPAAGGAAVLLTPGAFEVEHVALSAERREVLYSSNQDDIDRRHVWRVPAAGGRPAAISSETGLEWSPVATSDGKAIALLRADARLPGRPAIVVGGAPARDLAGEAIPASFPAKDLVEPQPVVFSAADGLKIHGQLFLPRGLKAGERRPGVLFLHGGSRRQMLLGWHYMEYYHNTYAFNQYLASRGYVVLSVNYRSGIGYGMELREALNYGARGASEFQDVLGAGLYLRSRPDVDPERIGLWGGSYGGYLTALGLSRASHLFAAGVDIHGVHDWNVVIRNFAPGYDPRERPEVARLAFESSPMASVKDWRSPVLLIHGDDDRNVPFGETVDLAEALRANGVVFESLVFPDEVHDFLVHARWLSAFEAAADFFERRLAGKKP